MAKSIEEIRAEMEARKRARAPASESPPGANGTTSEMPTPSRRDRIVPQRTRPRSREPEERQLPHDVEAEQGVLGSMLREPRFAIPLVIRRIPEPSAFHQSINQLLFADMVDHFRALPSMDMSTFTLYLEQVGHLQKVGGPSVISDLFFRVPSAAAVEYYLDIVIDNKVLRDLAIFGDRISAEARESGADRIGLVTDAHKQIEKVRLEASGESENVENFGFCDLLGFDPVTDPSILVGAGRWLCRGFTCLWAGAAGAGKSTLEMQLAIYWGSGLPCFGIKPARPLKSLIVQAENDLGDTGEQLQGVMEGIRKSGDMDIDGKRRALIEKNVIIKRVIGCTGDKFLALLESLIQTERPELVWVDPLFAFAGCDLKDAKETAHLVREGIIPIAVKRRCCIHVIHHVGKPDRDSKAKSGWTDIDFQYLGFGSSEIQNAFRAVNVMLPVAGEEKIYRLILSKRGSRAGAKSPDGEYTNNVYLTHAKEGICWLQVDKPDEPQKTTSKETQFQSKFAPENVLGEMSVTDGQKASALQKHMKAETGMAEKTFYRIWAKLKETGRIRVDSDGLWVLNPRTNNDQN